MQAKELLLQIGGWDECMKDGKFSISKAYKLLSLAYPKVSWRRAICNNNATPKSMFIIWLLAHQRLSTLDRLCN